MKGQSAAPTTSISVFTWEAGTIFRYLGPSGLCFRGLYSTCTSSLCLHTALTCGVRLARRRDQTARAGRRRSLGRPLLCDRWSGWCFALSKRRLGRVAQKGVRRWWQTLIDDTGHRRRGLLSHHHLAGVDASSLSHSPTRPPGSSVVLLVWTQCEPFAVYDDPARPSGQATGECLLVMDGKQCPITFT